jgi:hypothetical protein
MLEFDELFKIDSIQVEFTEREGILEDSYYAFHPGLEARSIPDELLALLCLVLLGKQSPKALYDFEALPSRSHLQRNLSVRFSFFN